jgi:hypothetical protein
VTKASPSKVKRAKTVMRYYLKESALLASSSPELSSEWALTRTRPNQWATTRQTTQASKGQIVKDQLKSLRLAEESSEDARPSTIDGISKAQGFIKGLGEALNKAPC